MTQTEIIAQVFSIIALLMTICSYQMKTPKGLLIFNTLADVAIAIAYYLLSAWSGMILNIICIVRNGIYYLRCNEIGGKTYFKSDIWVAILCVSMLAGGALSWDGVASILIMLSLAFNTYMMSLNDNQKLRWSIMLTSSVIIVYNIIVKNYAAILNEAFAIVSSIIGILRFRKKA